MPANRRSLNRELTLQRERTAWNLRLKGWTHRQIAGRLGVSRQRVGQILDRVWRRTLDRLDRDVRREVEALRRKSAR
jgi:hypothetical protein